MFKKLKIFEYHWNQNFSNNIDLRKQVFLSEEKISERLRFVNKDVMQSWFISHPITHHLWTPNTAPPTCIHAPPMHRPMHGPACPSTKSSIPSQWQDIHLDYMILLLYEMGTVVQNLTCARLVPNLFLLACRWEKARRRRGEVLQAWK